MLLKLLLPVMLFVASPAFASESVEVCAKYSTSSGWSKGYSVDAKVMTGLELSRATNSFDYNSYSKYVVIFWDQDQVSIIELDYSYLSSMGSNGIDQQGREWEIAKTSFCY